MNKYKELYQHSQLQINGLIDDISSGKFNPETVPSNRQRAYESLLHNTDRIICSNRYLWRDLPINLTSQQLESLFYEFGSLAIVNNNGTPMFTSYAMGGMLQPYGRLEDIEPISFSGKPYGFKAGVITQSGDNSKSKNSAIIINDYTAQYQQVYNNPRSFINKNTTIADQLDVFKQLTNNIYLSIKKAVALCDNEDQVDSVMNEVRRFLNATSPIIPISRTNKKTKNIGDTLEMFNFNNNFDTQNYVQTIEYYDKIRRVFNGIPSPDTFEKKERKITAETTNNDLKANLILLDGYLNRYNGLVLAKKYMTGFEKTTVEIQDVLRIERKYEESNVDYREEENDE